MISFEYHHKVLHCETTNLQKVAEQFGTPLYVYSKNGILSAFRQINEAFAEINHVICYALKANSNPHLLKLLAGAGAGADVVSGGELTLALEAGFDPKKIVSASVGKTDTEIADTTGMSLTAVKRNLVYLEDLYVADLTSDEIAKRRGELYSELTEAMLEARLLFDYYKQDKNEAVNIARFFSKWMQTVDMRAKLFGLDKPENIVQINQQFNDTNTGAANYVHDKIPSNIGERISKMLKDDHERKIKQKYEKV